MNDYQRFLSHLRKEEDRRQQQWNIEVVRRYLEEGKWDRDLVFELFVKNQVVVKQILREHIGYRIFFHLHSLTVSFINLDFFHNKINECCDKFDTAVKDDKKFTLDNELVISLSGEINSLFFGYLSSVYTYREFSSKFSDSSSKKNSLFAICEYGHKCAPFFNSYWCSIVMKIRNSLIHGKYINIYPEIKIVFGEGGNVNGVFKVNKSSLLSLSQLKKEEVNFINSLKDINIRDILDVHFLALSNHFSWLKETIISANQTVMEEANSHFEYIKKRSSAGILYQLRQRGIKLEEHLPKAFCEQLIIDIEHN